MSRASSHVSANTSVRLHMGKPQVDMCTVDIHADKRTIHARRGNSEKF